MVALVNTRTAVVLALGLMAVSQGTALADQCGIFGNDAGGQYLTSSNSNIGVKADLDFASGWFDSAESLGSGLIIDITNSDDWALVGTYRGVSPGGNCVDDDTGKNSYTEGSAFWGLLLQDGRVLADLRQLRSARHLRDRLLLLRHLEFLPW